MIRFKDKIDPYAPCYCGSGKKYRFCCQNRTFDLSAVSSLEADEERYEKAKQYHAKGHALMFEPDKLPSFRHRRKKGLRRRKYIPLSCLPGKGELNHG